RIDLLCSRGITRNRLPDAGLPDSQASRSDLRHILCPARRPLDLDVSASKMLDEINHLESTALAELAAVSDAAALEAWRTAYIGPNGKAKAMLARLKDVPKDQKPTVGSRLNQSKAVLEERFAARKSELGAGNAARPKGAAV